MFIQLVLRRVQDIQKNINILYRKTSIIFVLILFQKCLRFFHAIGQAQCLVYFDLWRFDKKIKRILSIHTTSIRLYMAIIKTKNNFFYFSTISTNFLPRNIRNSMFTKFFHNHWHYRQNHNHRPNYYRSQRKCVPHRHQLFQLRTSHHKAETLRTNAEKSTYRENFQRYFDDWRGDIDEPAWEEGGQSEEEEVAPQITRFCLSFYFGSPSIHSVIKKSSNEDLT